MNSEFRITRCTTTTILYNDYLVRIKVERENGSAQEYVFESCMTKRDDGLVEPTIQLTSYEYCVNASMV